MKRYVLKVNETTFVTAINWIIITIPVITTGPFEDVLVLEESYLNEPIGHNRYDKSTTRKELIKTHYPTIQFEKVKIVLDK
ncbi:MULTISPECIES: hypothetical protein [Solibacillus]|uniref:hypothetical protein n=1 Tax=Solibacillus TaxID=648800 RepID=UPI0011168D68|nr:MULTISPECIES: hypothetical protein [Solibacillus]